MTSIQVPRHESCPFCDYLAGRRPYTVLARTELAAVLVTREQRGLPHLLVVPVAHRTTILDVTDDEATALLTGVRAVARAIDECYGREGIAVWQNNGVPADQTVGHVHFHVAGTLDGGDTEWGPVPALPLTETDAVAVRIAPYLRLE
jgi:histidine triad (HIT) family protein